MKNIQTDRSYKSSSDRLICEITERRCVAKVVKLRDGPHPMNYARYFAKINQQSLYVCQIRILTTEDKEKLSKLIEEDKLKTRKRKLTNEP